MPPNALHLASYGLRILLEADRVRPDAIFFQISEMMVDLGAPIFCKPTVQVRRMEPSISCQSTIIVAPYYETSLDGKNFPGFIIPFGSNIRLIDIIVSKVVSSLQSGR